MRDTDERPDAETAAGQPMSMMRTEQDRDEERPSMRPETRKKGRTKRGGKRAPSRRGKSRY